MVSRLQRRVSPVQLATLIAIRAFGLAFLACGDDDSSSSEKTGAGAMSSAERCIHSWNAAANAYQQATLAGAMSAAISLEGEFRVGTWPKSKRTVPVTHGFAIHPSGRAGVARRGLGVRDERRPVRGLASVRLEAGLTASVRRVTRLR